MKASYLLDSECARSGCAVGGEGVRPARPHTLGAGETQPVLFFELFPAVLMILCFVVGIALFVANRRVP
jgi:hypothetical protein